MPFILAWVTPLVRRGWRVRLTLADVRGGAVGAATPKTAELLLRYDAIVGTYEQRMWKLSRLRLVGSAILYAIYACTQLAQPLLLRRVIQSVQEDSAEGIWDAVAVGVLVAIGSGCKEQQLMINFRIGVELRALTVALVYRRALAVREAELPRSVVNLFTMDAQKLYACNTLRHPLNMQLTCNALQPQARGSAVDQPTVGGAAADRRCRRHPRHACRYPDPNPGPGPGPGPDPGPGPGFDAHP